jgi:hypothetical protein
MLQAMLRVSGCRAERATQIEWGVGWVPEDVPVWPGAHLNLGAVLLGTESNCVEFQLLVIKVKGEVQIASCAVEERLAAFDVNTREDGEVVGFW